MKRETLSMFDYSKYCPVSSWNLSTSFAVIVFSLGGLLSIRTFFHLFFLQPFAYLITLPIITPLLITTTTTTLLLLLTTIPLLFSFRSLFRLSRIVSRTISGISLTKYVL